MKKNTKKTIRNVAIGTAAAAAIGYATYKLKDNPKVKKVAEKMKKEIVAKAKKVKAVTKNAYDKVAKEVADKYEKATHADVWSVLDIGKEIKQAWDHMKDVAQSATKEAKKSVRKVKSAVNKTRNKSSAKTA